MKSVFFIIFLFCVAVTYSQKSKIEVFGGLGPGWYIDPSPYFFSPSFELENKTAFSGVGAQLGGSYYFGKRLGVQLRGFFDYNSKQGKTDYFPIDIKASSTNLLIALGPEYRIGKKKVQFRFSLSPCFFIINSTNTQLSYEYFSAANETQTKELMDAFGNSDDELFPSKEYSFSPTQVGLGGQLSIGLNYNINKQWGISYQNIITGGETLGAQPNQDPLLASDFHTGFQYDQHRGGNAIGIVTAVHFFVSVNYTISEL